jgi:hypothetical protein
MKPIRKFSWKIVKSIPGNSPSPLLKQRFSVTDCLQLFLINGTKPSKRPKLHKRKAGRKKQTL